VGKRVFVPGLSLHVIRRGNDRTRIFRDEVDRLVFLKILRDAAKEHGTAVHGFVLMTTHYHALATPDDAHALSATMKSLGRRYVGYFNRKYERIGTLWAGRYRAILVDTEAYWLTCLRYIEQNPVRAGMVKVPEDYQWSSFRAHAFGGMPDWLADHALLRSLGRTARERQSAYRALCANELSGEEIAAVRFHPHLPTPNPMIASAVI
jgi:putative transposase